MNNPTTTKKKYVMAPISLVLLNPLGFLCMELGERFKENRRLSQQMISSTTDLSVKIEANKLSRTVSSASTASASSQHSNRKRNNGCKVINRAGNIKIKIVNIEIENIICNFRLGFFNSMEKHAFHSNRADDRFGYCCQFPLSTSNTTHLEKLVRGIFQI